MKRPFLISSMIGIGVIIIGLIINFIGPGPADNLPDGFITPIIAFEFASEDEQISHIFDKALAQDQHAFLRDMINSTRLDFLFLLLYGAFLFTFSITCVSLTGKRLYYLAALLAIIAPTFDILENMKLFAVMEQYASGASHYELETLRFYTWVKWGALALIFLLLFPFFRSSGKYGRFLSIFAVLPAALGVVAFLSPGLPNELFAISTIIMFLLMIIFSFVYRAR